MDRFYTGKKYLPCWSVEKKNLSKGKSSNPPPPAPQKSNGSPLGTEDDHNNLSDIQLR